MLKTGWGSGKFPTAAQIPPETQALGGFGGRLGTGPFLPGRLRLCVDPPQLCKGPVAVGKVRADGKSHFFPKGIARLVSGKGHQSRLVDSDFPKGCQQPLHQLPANAAAAEFRVDRRVVNVAFPPSNRPGYLTPYRRRTSTGNTAPHNPLCTDF